MRMGQIELPLVFRTSSTRSSPAREIRNGKAGIHEGVQARGAPDALAKGLARPAPSSSTTTGDTTASARAIYDFGILRRQGGHYRALEAPSP
jgi:hypothetical protein